MKYSTCLLAGYAAGRLVSEIFWRFHVDGVTKLLILLMVAALATVLQQHMEKTDR